MRDPAESTVHARRKRRQQRIAELESVVERQAGEIAYLVQQLRRAKPKRPKMSATRSVWIAGSQGYKCAGDKATCPCWLLPQRGGLFGPEGWQIDHIQPYARSYDDRTENCRALCATCHFRVTKEQIMNGHSDDDDED